MKHLTVSFLLTGLLLIALSGFGKRLNVLAIGNSFSADAVEQYLWELASEAGDTLVIGNAYIGGCNIDRHVANFENNAPAYSYRLIEKSLLSSTEEVTLQEIIVDKDWDIISLQQASPLSGKAYSYGNLPLLISYIKETMPNKDAEIIWHNTWAYARDFDSDNFKYYDNSQEAMYDSIMNVVRTIIPLTGIDRVVPSGIAIQNAREVFGDILNRDGYHLAIPLGRFIAACTWAEFLTGKDARTLKFIPESLNEKEARKAKEAAHSALVEKIVTDKMKSRPSR